MILRWILIDFLIDYWGVMELTCYVGYWLQKCQEAEKTDKK